MNQNLIRTALAGAVIAGTVTLAACGSNGTSGMPGMSSSSPSSSASSSAGSSATANFNDADVTFAQMMIQHHQQAIGMSDMVLTKKGVDAEVIAVAEQIKTAQQPEIQTMTGWLKDWGSAPSSSMSGMGGMESEGGMSTDEMQQLEQADGATGQKLFLEGMVKHHKGAIAMARTEISQGKNPDAVALANNIVASQQKEITTMNDLLAKM